MERVFSVEEIPDPYWGQPSPRASAAPGAGANAQPGGGVEGGAMNRCPSEWYFQKFLEEAVLDSPAGDDPSPMAGTNEAVIGEEVKKPAVPAPVAATSAVVVDPVEYNAMLKQKLEKDLAAVAMWRASGANAMPPERFAPSSSLPNADVPHIGTSNPIGGNVAPVQNKLVGGASGGLGPHLVQNVDALVKQAASSSSREQSDDDDMEGEDEITGNATPTDQRLRRRKQSNRESARRSRSGKAAHLNEPEAQVSQLRVENSSLIRRLADVNQKYNGAAVDNRVLKADVETLRAKMSSEDMEMGNESESDLEVQNQESEEGDGRGKEIVQVDEETMDGLERKKEEESAALNKDKEDGDAKTGRKEMAARSEMWNHFTKIFVEGVLRKGKCKYCKREIKAHAVKNGTSALQKHFGVCKRNPHIHLKDPKQGVLQVTDFVGCWKFDPDKLRAAFSQMIIEDELPFAFGEKSGFKKFMFVACPRFKPPSRRTCTRDAVGTYYEEKAKLKLFFQEQCERVCITTDCWTSQQQDSYMTVTAHFIDKEWKLHKKIINFFKIKGHRGDDIGKHLLTCLMEWGLDKVMTITVDNASSNDGGISYVRKHMKSLIAGGKYLHMRCAAHIVNLIVSDGLKEVDVSVKRVRAAVRYVKNGTTRLDKFKECADLEKVDTKAFLNLDVCTRWNSTHDMLKAAIIYEKVFTRYADEDPYFSIDLLSEKSGGVQGLGIPEELDWDNAKKMAEFLGHFADLTVRVSASLNVTSNTFFHEIGEVNLLVRSWLESEDSLQREMGKRMKDKYDKYWGKWHEKDLEKEKGKGKEKENINLMIFMAAVLDPRYKLSEYTEIAIGEMYGEGNGQKVWSAINKCLHELFEEYRAMYAPVASDSPPQSSDAPRKETGKGGSASMMKELIAKKMRLNTGASNSSKSELEKYLAEDCEDIESKIFDILDWWKTNSSRFPILAQLARDVLAIPISTVASESAFSMGGRVLDDFRTSLTPFMVEAIVCTQDWLRRSTPINIQENTEELAKLEEELIKEFKNEATI